MVFDKIKKSISGAFGSKEDPEYIEIDLGKEVKKAKILVRPFILRTFEDVTPILNSLREGYTIAIVDFRPIKQKDIIETKRAISKLQKTASALDGSIAGFGENVLIITPQFAEIYKAAALPSKKSEGNRQDNLLEE